jgi:uncharacterized protein YifN (PemK superfamily)
MKKNNNDKDYIKLNVAIEYRSNSHLLLVKVLDVVDDDEFDRALYFEITKRLSKEYPNKKISPEKVAYRVCSNIYNVTRHRISTDDTYYHDMDRVAASISYLLHKKLNHFIEYKGQRYFLRLPIAPESEAEAIINAFLIEKYPNDEFNPAEIDYESCLPIARFDDHVIMNNKGDGFDFELTQFKNLIDIMIYCGQVEKGILHNGLIETIKSADDDIQIISEFKATTFQLIAFTTRYIAHITYAFIGNGGNKADNEKHKQPIFGCMPKKEVKKIADNYMDDITYNSWFGARLKVV